MAWSWLNLVAVTSLMIAVGCSLWIAIDECFHPQRMKIMNLVWPLTALYGGLFVLWAYFKFGRPGGSMPAASHRSHQAHQPESSFAAYGLATSHCGSGCMLGDLVAEWSIYFFPAILTWCGYPSLFDRRIFAGWVLDFALAFAFGIAFQYFTIVPMRHLSFGEGLVAAIKADTLSLSAWQVGMYGWMAIASFAIFGRELSQGEPAFWLMMQIAMICGFATSYPINIWLVRRGIKETM